MKYHRITISRRETLMRRDGGYLAVMGLDMDVTDLFIFHVVQ